MKRISKTFLTFILISLLIKESAAALSVDALYPMAFTAVKSTIMLENANKKQPEIPGYHLIAGNPNRGVFVYGRKIDNEPYYNQVLVKTRTSQKLFNWKATDKDPGLMFSDLTGSGKDNIIIVFVTAYGTGYYQTQMHVLDSEGKQEIPYENPVLAAKRLIKAGTQGQNIVFKSENREFKTRLPMGEKNINEEIQNLQYGSIVNYSMENNRLKAIVSVQTNPNYILGEFTMLYDYQDGKLTPHVTAFKSYI